MFRRIPGQRDEKVVVRHDSQDGRPDGYGWSAAKTFVIKR